MKLPDSLRPKKLRLILTTVAIAYLSMEILSYITYSAVFREAFSLAQLKARQVEIIGDSNQNAATSAEPMKENKQTFAWHEVRIHPYMGYVAYAPNDPLWKENGFYAEENPLIASQDPDKFIVGISGASVAENFFHNEKKRALLKNWLTKAPQLKNRKIILALFATGAYHQPQQLLSLSYYLAQGGRLNMLIELDGISDAGAPVRNVKANTYPTFPYFWKAFLENKPQLEYPAMLGELMAWRKMRITNATMFSHVDFSISATTLWAIVDKMLEQKIASTELSINTLSKNGGYNFHINGPRLGANKKPVQWFNMQKTLWLEGSTQMGYLAKANHFDYFHFLQPSPYLPETKVLTSQEQAMNDEYYKFCQRSLYPLFKASFGTLRERGINIYDLTRIFKNTKDTIYTDGCCHINDLGDEILINAIGKHILDYYNHQPH